MRNNDDLGTRDTDRHGSPEEQPPEEQGAPQQQGRAVDMPVDLKEIVDGMEMQSDESRTLYDRATGKVVFLPDEYVRQAEGSDEEEEADEFDDPLDEEPAQAPPHQPAEWEQEMIDLARQVTGDESRFVALPDRFEIDEWRMMRDFAISLSDAALGERLLRAIHGRGAFRCFKDLLYDARIEKQWFA